MSESRRAFPFELDSIDDLRKISHVLDSQFRLPGGWRVGWDGILGFIPGVGDFITSLFSFYILCRAAILGCPPSILIRMGLNIFIDNLFDIVPILGNVFDFIWKSNNQNVALLDSYLSDPHRTVHKSRWLIAITLTAVAFLIFSVVILTFVVASWLWGVFQQAL